MDCASSVRASVRPSVRPDLYLGHPWTDSFQTLYIPRTLSGTYARAMVSWLDQRWLTGGHLDFWKWSILDLLCLFLFKFGTYITHVRIYVHDNLFHIRIKDGRLAAILFFWKCVVSWTCFVSFHSDLVHTLYMLGHMSMTICSPIRSKMADRRPSCFLKKCGILDMLCQYLFKFGTYITHVRIYVPDNLFHNQIKDGRLAAILIFENVWYLGHALSVFVQIWYIHYTC